MAEPTAPPAPQTPLVSVIIPVYNDAGPLASLLEHLARQTYPAGRTEVLVVDNGSTQDIGAVLRQHLPAARLLKESTPGSYAARNHALTQATGEVLAFTDADCLPTPTWLERGVAALASDPALGMVAGHVELFARDPARPTGAELYDMTYGLRQREYVEQENFGVTANLFTRRAVVQAVGPFNAQLKSRGDYEWGRRVHAAGYRQAFAADAVVRHPARPNLRTLAQKQRRLRGGVVGLGELPKVWHQRAYRWGRRLIPPRTILPKAREHAARYGRGAGLRFYGAFYWVRVVGTFEEIRLSIGGGARR